MQNFYNQLAPIAGIKPYMAAPGNHEAVCIEQHGVDMMCPRGQKNFTDFMNRFGRIAPMPFPSMSKNATARALAAKAASLALPPMWYSYEYGMAHVGMYFIHDNPSIILADIYTSHVQYRDRLPQRT